MTQETRKAASAESQLFARLVSQEPARSYWIRQKSKPTLSRLYCLEDEAVDGEENQANRQPADESESKSECRHACADGRQRPNVINAVMEWLGGERIVSHVATLTEMPEVAKHCARRAHRD
jgi:hypothetical protein